MSTQLQIVNKVLTRLREDEVTSVSDSEYAQLVAEFVNDVMREMQEEHQWSALRTEVSTSCVIGTPEYDLSADINDDSDLLWVWCTTADKEHALSWGSFENLRILQLSDPDAETGEPYTFGVENMTLRLYPIPDDTYTIVSKWYIPQVDLEVDGTDDNTEISIPARPVYLGALFLALNERGEELGEPGSIAERRYLSSKSDAMLRDEAPRTATNYHDAYRD